MTQQQAAGACQHWWTDAPGHTWRGVSDLQRLVPQGEVVSAGTIWTGNPAKPLSYKAAAAYRAAFAAPLRTSSSDALLEPVEDDTSSAATTAAGAAPCAIELATGPGLPQGLV